MLLGRWLCKSLSERLTALWSVTFNQGDYETAQSLLAESLTLSAELDDALGVAYNLAGLAEVAMMLNYMGRAAALVAVVEKILVDIKAALEPAYRTRLDKIVTTTKKLSLGHRFSQLGQQGNR